MRVRKLRQESRMLRPRRYPGLLGVFGAAFAAFAMVSVVFSSVAVTVDIAPDSLNVFNSTGNYMTAYVEPTIVFKDDFNDAAWTSANWQVLNGLWTVDGSEYSGEGLVESRSASLAGAMVCPIEVTDFDLRVTATTLQWGPSETSGGSTHSYGALVPFRWTDGNHMALLAFFNDCIRLQFATTSGGWNPSDMVYYWTPIDLGVSHDLRIVAVGSLYEVYLDDLTVPKISKTFSSPDLGKRLGVWAAKGAHAHFDSFVVTEPFDPSTVDIGSVKLWHAWSDDFEDGAADGWLTHGSGTWSTMDDSGNWVYAGQAAGDEVTSYAAAMSVSRYRDFILEVKMKALNSEGHYGVIIRDDGSGNHYGFYLNGYSTAVGKYYFGVCNGATYTPSPGTSWYSSNGAYTSATVWNTLKVVATGDTFALYINGVLVETRTQTGGPAEGTIGLIVDRRSSGAVGQKTAFDEVVVMSYITSAVIEPACLGDYDYDGVCDLMVKFDRATVAQYLRDRGILTGEVDLAVTGETDDGAAFSGCDSIKVISKGKLKL